MGGIFGHLFLGLRGVGGVQRGVGCGELAGCGCEGEGGGGLEAQVFTYK